MQRKPSQIVTSYSNTSRRTRYGSFLSVHNTYVITIILRKNNTEIKELKTKVWQIFFLLTHLNNLGPSIFQQHFPYSVTYADTLKSANVIRKNIGSEDMNLNQNFNRSTCTQLSSRGCRIFG
jgi:hypothetical protein